MKKTRNKFEQKIYNQLKRAKIPFGYETERITYLLSGYYLPDFIITTPTGKVYIETKGYLRPEHRRKMVSVRKLHPEIDLRILFYAHNKKYIKWAEKNGIKWSVEKIPTDWLKGL